MKKLMSLLILSSLILVACGQQKGEVPQQESPVSVGTGVKSSQEEKGEAVNQLADQDSQEGREAPKAISNGLYYSVPGKYGSVIIVNKKHALDPAYAPGEDPQALAAFWELVGAMRAQGFAISDSYSGFRSYDHQASLYSNYVAQDGQAAADRYSARPGHSEHQTGLAFDLLDSAGQLLEEPAASAWLANNAHHYGFVVRYLPGKEDITGYMAESWHVRYIGPEASDIYASGLTLEEYYGVPGGGYTD